MIDVYYMYNNVYLVECSNALLKFMYNIRLVFLGEQQYVAGERNG